MSSPADAGEGGDGAVHVVAVSADAGRVAEAPICRGSTNQVPIKIEFIQYKWVSRRMQFSTSCHLRRCCLSRTTSYSSKDCLGFRLFCNEQHIFLRGYGTYLGRLKACNTCIDTYLYVVLLEHVFKCITLTLSI
jgi:hypothetical protein